MTLSLKTVRVEYPCILFAGILCAPKLSVPVNRKIESVTYNSEELEFNAVDDKIVFPFSGNGVYAYSVQEESTASESVQRRLAGISGIITVDKVK